jgi:hypothetical protein
VQEQVARTMPRPEERKPKNQIPHCPVCQGATRVTCVHLPSLSRVILADTHPAQPPRPLCVALQPQQSAMRAATVLSVYAADASD